MRRLVLLVPVLLAVVAATFVVTHDWSDDRQVAAPGLTADVLPYPGATTPLPVPEVDITHPAWRDESAPFAAVIPPPTALPRGGCVKQIPRFKGKSTSETPPRVFCAAK